MRKRATSDLEQQHRLRLQERERELEEFVGRWDWGHVYWAWSQRIKDFNVTLSPLFLTVNIHDPKHPTGRPSEHSWWPAGEIHDLRAECQRHFIRWPGTRGSPHPSGREPTKGEVDTVRHLWEHRSDAEMIAAILISASLFSRLHSRRAHYPEAWPKAHCVRRLDQWAREKWLAVSPGITWHPLSTDVLPVMSEDYFYKIDSMSGLVRYLAEEHASSLQSFRPVEIRFSETPDPFIERALDTEREIERRRSEEFSKLRQKADEEEAQRVAELKMQHPRWGEFTRLTKDELTKLVWSKPTTQLAQEFGVSDVAIGKRCKIQGIPKPPPGFWRRVEAGQIPNPMGIPAK